MSPMAQGMRIVEVRGTAELKRILDAAPARATHALASALYAEALEIMAASQRQVPVRYGILKASGHVTPPEISGEKMSVTLGYGGAASSYSIIVHERVYRHKPGVGQVKIRHDDPTKAKFLEDPINEHLGSMPRHLAQRTAARAIFGTGSATGGGPAGAPDAPTTFGG